MRPPGSQVMEQLIENTHISEPEGMVCGVGTMQSLDLTPLGVGPFDYCYEVVLVAG